jgi:hypothetical protein
MFFKSSALIELLNYNLQVLDFKISSTLTVFKRTWMCKFSVFTYFVHLFKLLRYTSNPLLVYIPSNVHTVLLVYLRLSVYFEPVCWSCASRMHFPCSVFCIICILCVWSYFKLFSKLLPCASSLHLVFNLFSYLDVPYLIPYLILNTLSSCVKARW